MSRKLFLNGCNTILIRDENGALDVFDNVMLNGCNIIATPELNAKLLAINGMFNGCKIRILDVAPQNPVYVSGCVRLGGDSAYDDKYLLCKEAIATLESVEAMERMEGLTVLGTLYHEQSVPKSALAKVNADQYEAFPDGAQLVLDGETYLSMENEKQWRDNTHYYLTKKFIAADGDALAALKNRGVTYRCDTLCIGEDELKLFSSMLTSNKQIIVPAGYAYAPKGMSLANLYANYGDKIYLTGDLTINRNEIKHLSLMTSIIVKGKVTLPLDVLAEAKKVIKADRFDTYEGELMNIDSFQMLGKDALKSALASDIGYTVRVKGALIMGDDVTPEDVKAIKSLDVKGFLSAPGATHAYLSSVGSVKGIMLGSIPEIKKMLSDFPEEAQKMLGGALPEQILDMLGLSGSEKKDESTVLNGDDYILI